MKTLLEETTIAFEELDNDESFAISGGNAKYYNAIVASLVPFGVPAGLATYGGVKIPTITGLHANFVPAPGSATAGFQAGLKYY